MFIHFYYDIEHLIFFQTKCIIFATEKYAY